MILSQILTYFHQVSCPKIFCFPCVLKESPVSGDLILKTVPFLDPLTKLMFLLPKNKQIYIKNTLKQYRLYCILPAYEHCIRSLLKCIFKTKLELALCLFLMILSYCLRSLFTEIYIFYEMFFSVFLSLLPLYLNANFRARFRFMIPAIVNAQRVSCYI